MRSIPDIVKQLIIINVLFFAGSFLINPNITAIDTDLLGLALSRQRSFWHLAIAHPYVYAWWLYTYPF